MFEKFFCVAGIKRPLVFVLVVLTSAHANEIHLGGELRYKGASLFLSVPAGDFDGLPASAQLDFLSRFDIREIDDGVSLVSTLGTPVSAGHVNYKEYTAAIGVSAPLVDQFDVSEELAVSFSVGARFGWTKYKTVFSSSTATIQNFQFKDSSNFFGAGPAIHVGVDYDITGKTTFEADGNLFILVGRRSVAENSQIQLGALPAAAVNSRRNTNLRFVPGFEGRISLAYALPEELMEIKVGFDVRTDFDAFDQTEAVSIGPFLQPLEPEIPLFSFSPFIQAVKKF